MTRRIQVSLSVFCLLAGFAVQLSALTIDRDEYADRLRAYWAGQSLANWTGLRTENMRPGWSNSLSLYTNADWGTYNGRDGLRIYWVFPEDVPGGNPNAWGADDDTDIEYMYLHLMHSHATATLSPEQIRDGWLQHIATNSNGTPQFLWVSNESAWGLMRNFAQVPPHTGMLEYVGTPNHAPNALMIDAQLTTEFFGLFAPALPTKALEIADLPISTTADGYAYHASQFNVLLLSFASAADPTLSIKDKVFWILEETRQLIPDTSRVAEMYDFIKADYLANPNKEDWERTRNKIAQRYQQNASQNGFRYFTQVASAINHAAGIMALFYGEGDYQKTVRIGALAGWDSDNPTSSNGAFIAFLLGHAGLQEQFPDRTFPDRYNIFRTRVNFPDYLPDDIGANDTFTLMADRMLPLIDDAVEEAGGIVDLANNRWIIPDPQPANLGMNPRWQLRLRSANIRVREEGGTVTPASNAGGNPSALADGWSHLFEGKEIANTSAIPVYQGSAVSSATVSVTYDRGVEVDTIRLIQGGLFGASSGRFTSLEWQARIDGEWITLQGTAPAIVPEWRVQLIDFIVDAPVYADGIRVTGNVAGGNLSLFELDAFSSPFSDSEGGVSWGGIESGSSGWIDTQNWLGWLHIVNTPWVYSDSLQSWTYALDPEEDADGAWIYVLKY